MRILIIDDDVQLASMLVEYLQGHGVHVAHVARLAQAAKALDAGAYDAIVLDLMLPDGDGSEWCRSLRARGDTTPVLMLTALGEDTDRIVGLELGADDYMAKPFNPRELLARLRAITRRNRSEASTKALVFGDLRVDPIARRAWKGGEVAVLTSHQFSLLLVLAERADRVLTRDQLMELVRGEELTSFDRSIDVHISRIRAAIENDPKSPRRIQTVRGVGYVFSSGEV